VYKTSHCGDIGSIAGQSILDLCWINQQGSGFSSSTGTSVIFLSFWLMFIPLLSYSRLNCVERTSQHILHILCPWLDLIFDLASDENQNKELYANICLFKLNKTSESRTT
jgi:hypothetical protein